MKWNKRNCKWILKDRFTVYSCPKWDRLLYFCSVILVFYGYVHTNWKEYEEKYSWYMMLLWLFPYFEKVLWNFAGGLIKKKFIRIIDIFIPSFLEMEVKLILHQKTCLVTFNINNSLPLQIYNKRIIWNKFWILHSFKFKSIEIIVKIDNRCIIIEFIAKWCNFLSNVTF